MDTTTLYSITQYKKNRDSRSNVCPYLVGIEYTYLFYYNNNMLILLLVINNYLLA